MLEHLCRHLLTGDKQHLYQPAVDVHYYKQTTSRLERRIQARSQDFGGVRFWITVAKRGPGVSSRAIFEKTYMRFVAFLHKNRNFCLFFYLFFLLFLFFSISFLLFCTQCVAWWAASVASVEVPLLTNDMVSHSPPSPARSGRAEDGLCCSRWLRKVWSYSSPDENK